MKRLFFILVVTILCLTMSNAFAYDHSIATDSSIYADVIIGELKKLDIVDVQRVKDEAEKIIEEKQKENALDPEYLGVWQERYFVDQFNDPTDEKYILGLFEGTFSNFATNNSPLTVKMLIYMEKGKPRIGIELYEYGDSKVKNSSSKQREYYFKVKDENGEIHQFVYGMWSERMSFLNLDLNTWAKDEQEVIDMLKTKKTLKFSFYDNDQFYSSKYRFDINDTTGFENALNWLLEQ